MLYENQTNKVFLRGEVVSEKRFCMQKDDLKYYETELAVKRLSGQSDIIPIRFSNINTRYSNFEVGETVCVLGKYCSQNKLVDGKSKLCLFVQVHKVIDDFEAENSNLIAMTGYICKQPNYRTTPFEREICDILVAINNGKDDANYIPCIAWSKNARYASHLSVGDKVSIVGRIQSREYQKKISETETKTMTAYEVSITKIVTIDVVQGFDVEEEFAAYQKEKSSDQEIV